MFEIFQEPFRHEFMRYALGAILLAGVSCGPIGSYVVLRRMTFLTSALSHTVLPGLVMAAIVGFSPLLGALMAGLCTAATIGFVWMRRGEVREDTAIGIVHAAFFALGIGLLQWAGGARDLSGLLLGSILGVTGGALWGLGLLAACIGGFLLLFHKELELVSVDSEYASIIGLHPAKLNGLLLLLVALSVVCGIQIMGALLVTTLIVVPAAAAALIASTLPGTMLWATFFAIVSGITGLYASYYGNIPAGAAIALSTCLLFLLIRLCSHKSGA